MFKCAYHDGLARPALKALFTSKECHSRPWRTSVKVEVVEDSIKVLSVQAHELDMAGEIFCQLDAEI